MYFLEWYKELTILLAPFTIAWIYPFHLRSGVSFRFSRHSNQGASFRVWPFLLFVAQEFVFVEMLNSFLIDESFKKFDDTKVANGVIFWWDKGSLAFLYTGQTLDTFHRRKNCLRCTREICTKNTGRIIPNLDYLVSYVEIITVFPFFFSQDPHFGGLYNRGIHAWYRPQNHGCVYLDGHL